MNLYARQFIDSLSFLVDMLESSIEIQREYIQKAHNRTLMEHEALEHITDRLSHLHFLVGMSPEQIVDAYRELIKYFSSVVDDSDRDHVSLVFMISPRVTFADGNVKCQP
jgi:hypothetical protein